MMRIEDIQNVKKLNVYPNPTNGSSLSISINADINEESSIEIYDVSGVLKHEIARKSYQKGDQVQLSNLNLNSGSYILLLKSGTQLSEYTRFVVIQ